MTTKLVTTSMAFCDRKCVTCHWNSTVVRLNPDSLLKSVRLESCSRFKCFPYDYLTWHHKYFEVILNKNHMVILTLTGSSWFRWAVSVQIRQRTYARDSFLTPNGSSVDLFHPEYHLILIGKVGCVFPMVIVSIVPHAEFGPNDHREDASHFIN